MSGKLKIIASVFILSVIISGCSNPYSKYYSDYTNGVNVLEDESVIPPRKEPHVLTGSGLEADNRRMIEDGFWLIGESIFNGSDVNSDDAIKHAQKIHADTVIVYRDYINTESGAVPLTVPNMQTSYHSGNIYGGGGSANYYGSSTTYGTTTAYLPYNVQRYDYRATYWVKEKMPRLGIQPGEVPDELKKKMGTGKGVYVWAVRKGSPAFDNDILWGDVIRRINDVEIIDLASFDNILGKINEAQIELYRDGETITKKVRLNP